MVADDEHFDSFRLHAIKELVGKPRKEGHTAAFVGRGPVVRMALNRADHREEFIEKAVTQARRSVFVVAPGFIEVFLDLGVIDHFHRRRL